MLGPGSPHNRDQNAAGSIKSARPNEFLYESSNGDVWMLSRTGVEGARRETPAKRQLRWTNIVYGYRQFLRDGAGGQALLKLIGTPLDDQGRSG
jgi:hypothetical protein